MSEDTKPLRPHPTAARYLGVVRRGVRFPLLPLLVGLGHGAHAARRVVGLARVCPLRRARRVRGFALIPVTNLVVLAIPLFPPVPLLVLTLVGIAISSASIYAFAGSLRLGEYFERKHARHMERLQNRAASQPDFDRHGVELPTDRADGFDLLRLRRHAHLVPPLHVRRARRRRRDLRDLHLRRRELARSRQARIRRRRRRSTSRGATCGRRGLRRALRALPRASRRAHSASHGATAAAGRAHRARARCGRNARDCDVDESRRATRRRRVSRHRRRRHGTVRRRLLHRSRGGARHVAAHELERMEPGARQRALSTGRARRFARRASAEPAARMGVRFRRRRHGVRGAHDRGRPRVRRQRRRARAGARR